MKKIFSCFSIAVVGLMSIACQKDIIPTNNGSGNSDVSVDQARSFFESKYGDATSRVKEDSKERRVLWERAYNKSTTHGQAVAVPIDLEGDRYNVGDGKSLPYSDVNYLLVYKDAKNGMQDEWVELRPDQTFLYSDQKKYTGDIIVNTWDGDVKRVFHYLTDGSVKEWSVTKVKRDTKNGRTSDFVYTTCITVFVPTQPGDPTRISTGPDSETTGTGGAGPGKYQTFCKETEVWVDDPWGGTTGTAGSGGVGNDSGFLHAYMGWNNGSGGTGTGGNYTPQCDPNIPPGTSVPPNQLPPCQVMTPDPGGITWHGVQSDEANMFDEGDPESLWWEVQGFNWLPQAAPSWLNFNAAYPKNASDPNKEMASPDVYALVGGKVLDQYLADPVKYKNACAVRMSRALNYSGVKIPYIASATSRGADGKYYFFSVPKMFTWLNEVFRNHPNVKEFDYNDGGPGGFLYLNKLKPSKGIYVMKPNYPGKPRPAGNGLPYRPGFDAQGHWTKFDGNQCMSNNCYFGADGGVNLIKLWILN